MEVWVVFENRSWCDADWHTEWNIYGIYNSEAKAREVMTSLQKEEEDYMASVHDDEDIEEISYRIETHYVQ